MNNGKKRPACQGGFVAGSNLARRMGLLTLLAATALSLASTPQLARAKGAAGASPPAGGALGAVAPALERYERHDLFGNLWRRPDLSPRDRSLVTLSALIARNQARELPGYLNRALDSGLRPGEISELITHMAFYAGWGNAREAAGAAARVFARHGIGADQLPSAEARLLPLNEAAEAQRAAMVAQTVRPVVPGLDQFTTDILFRDLWLRFDLAPRDRSLVTFSALITAGQAVQVPYHLNRAMDNGLTRAEAAEVVTHLASYAGWPNAFSAVPVLKGVFDSRRD